MPALPTLPVVRVEAHRLTHGKGLDVLVMVGAVACLQDRYVLFLAQPSHADLQSLSDHGARPHVGSTDEAHAHTLCYIQDVEQGRRDDQRREAFRHAHARNVTAPLWWAPIPEPLMFRPIAERALFLDPTLRDLYGCEHQQQIWLWS